MRPYYDENGVTIYHGDCREVLPLLSGVDAVVTDPPYGLSFMGKGWDRGVPGVEFWQHVSNAVKPGAHVAAFGGTRTYHRLACAIEDAGFEIRDCLSWLYGSGFPKSLDVSKAIDKAAGAEREVVGNNPNFRPNKEAHGAKIMRPMSPGEAEVRTAPATDAGRAWSGWGTALKPAHEPITLARKPLAGTVAANVLAHGTGALNVDGCRIETTDGYAQNAVTQGINTARTSYEHRRERRTFKPASGRWPANVLLDEEAARMLDEQSGYSVTPDFVSRGRARTGNAYSIGSDDLPTRGISCFGDSGGASRFFYTSKTSSAERDQFGEGNDHPTVKPLDLMRWLVRLLTPPGALVLDPFMGSGSTIQAAQIEGRRAIGIELDERYCEIAAKRLAQCELFRAVHAAPADEPEQGGLL